MFRKYLPIFYLAFVATLGTKISLSEACSYPPCPFFINADLLVVAPNGVLAYKVDWFGWSSEDLPADFQNLINFNVKDASGRSIDGQKYMVGQHLIFKPNASLEPNSTVFAELRLSDTLMRECYGWTMELRTQSSTFTVSADEIVGSSFPEITVSEQIKFEQDNKFSTQVCCDGAIPRELVDSCGGRDIAIRQGTCTSTSGTGFATSKVALTNPSELSADYASILVFEFIVDGKVVDSRLGSVFKKTENERNSIMSLKLGRSFDVLVRTTNLLSNATDEVTRSIGLGVEERLGALPTDMEAFEAACSGVPYVCEATGGPFNSTWVPDKCQDFVAGTTTSTTGPNRGDATNPPGSLNPSSPDDTSTPDNSSNPNNPQISQSLEDSNGCAATGSSIGLWLLLMPALWIYFMRRNRRRS